jgi:hypothetical protein
MLPSSSSVHRPSSPVPLVGSALARPEGGGFSVDFFWTPRYSTAGRAFVAQFLLDLAAPCEMLIAASDDWKQSEARRLGFRPVAGSEQWVEIQGQSFHLIRHRRD